MNTWDKPRLLRRVLDAISFLTGPVVVLAELITLVIAAPLAVVVAIQAASCIGGILGFVVGVVAFTVTVRLLRFVLGMFMELAFRLRYRTE